MVAKQDLTEDMIQGGRALLEAMDKSDVSVTRALWHYTSDPNRWRLVLGIKQAEELGPLGCYKIVHKALEKCGPEALPLDTIVATDPADALLRRVRRLVRTGKTIKGIRSFGRVVDGYLIEDAYIYRSM